MFLFNKLKTYILWYCLILLVYEVNTILDEGQLDIIMNENMSPNDLCTVSIFITMKWIKTNVTYAHSKTLFKGSTIYVLVRCEPMHPAVKLNIQWILSYTPCLPEYIRLSNDFERKQVESYIMEMTNKTANTMEYTVSDQNCSKSIDLFSQSPTYLKNGLPLTMQKKEPNEFPSRSIPESESKGLQASGNKSENSFLHIPIDGFYLLIIRVQSSLKVPFNASVHIESKGPDGFLSAADAPLLRFYEFMCVVYLILGVIWLIISSLQWRDLLPIQFWIGGVILLGMLEKAAFYTEYNSINTSGRSSLPSLVLFAELVSCGKRTLARMLVIIVSLGFGIVKPRLGPLLHRVVSVGILYFTFAASEAYWRVVFPKRFATKQFFFSVLLAVLDSSICWWIFTSLVQTTRTLRLRRNVVKLTLYKHFTNTLIFAVVASIIFMLYSIKAFHFPSCLWDWKELWVDQAYWHLLFSVILLVIMILWRPTNNNQRYAFTPLLDGPDDDDDEDEEKFISDAYGVKLRNHGSRSGSPKPNKSASTTNSAEEDLKWVEENIPTALIDTTLPILDSDEEVMTTKFEISKMQ